MFSILFALSLIFSGPAHAGVKASDLVVELGTDLRGQSRIETRELARDIEVLKTAVQNGYAGPRFDSALNSVSTSPGSSREFCERLVPILSRVRDAHLRAAVDFRNCGPALPRGRVGNNIAPPDQWILKTVPVDGGAVDVLAIPTFWPRFDARWDGFLDAVRDLRAKNRPFILDLRGNTGGDDSMGFEMARVLLGLPEFVNLPSPILRRHYSWSAESFALQSNIWAWSILKLRNEGKPVPPYMEQRRDELLGWMTQAERGELPREHVEELTEVKIDSRLIFQPKILVLTDRACVSACETTLQVLEKLPGRRLVGENTFGAIEYGEVGRVVLPHSKVVVSLSTMNVKFRDGRRPEKSGYAPDLAVPPGGDALEAALNSL